MTMNDSFQPQPHLKGKLRPTALLITWLLTISMLLAPVKAFGYATQPENRAFQSERANDVAQNVVVQFKQDADPFILAHAVGAELVRREPGNFAKLKVTGNRSEALAKLNALPGVLSAEESRMFKISAVATEMSGTIDQGDPEVSRQWGLFKSEVPQAWDLGADGSGITIAVVDTGIDLNHPDLKDNLVPGYNAILDSTSIYDQQDQNGHGTHVAGIAAAAKGNGYGISGVAYNAKIMPIKAMDRDGEGQDTDIARGIRWAVDHGANIINLSLGSDGEEPILRAAVQYALNKNCLVVAAAGNDDTGSNAGVAYPAADPGVIAVSAVDPKGAFADFSVSGPEIDLAAPGVEILSDYWQRRLGSTYAFLDGTSMAAPFVAGSAALVWSKHRDWSASRVHQALENGAVDVDRNGRDQELGFGLVDPYRALLVSSTLPDLTSPANVSLDGGLIQGQAGVNLKVPAKTFTKDMTFTLRNIASPKGFPAGITPGGTAFEVKWQTVGVSADDSSVENPQKMLSLSVSTDSIQSGLTGYIFHWTGRRWITVGGREASGSVQAGIYEPGIYRVGYVPSTSQARLAGVDRLGTAIQIADAAYPSGADTVILARADDFPDALAGVPLAYKLHAPILLTYPNHMDDRVRTEIEKLAPEKIVLLGGSGALTAAVEAEARAMAPTDRIQGENRYETAAAIATALGTRGEAILVNGDNFPDALAAASPAALLGEPILLTQVDTLPAETDKELRTLAVSHLTVVGGEGVVTSASILNLSNITRLAGSDRYGTAMAVLKAFTPQSPQIFVATGEDFPDALAGGVLAAVQNSGILLVSPYGLTHSQKVVLDSWGKKIPIALGGLSVLPDAVLTQIGN